MYTDFRVVSCMQTRDQAIKACYDLRDAVKAGADGPTILLHFCVLETAARILRHDPLEYIINLIKEPEAEYIISRIHQARQEQVQGAAPMELKTSGKLTSALRKCGLSTKEILCTVLVGLAIPALLIITGIMTGCLGLISYGVPAVIALYALILLILSVFDLKELST